MTSLINHLIATQFISHVSVEILKIYSNKPRSKSYLKYRVIALTAKKLTIK